jgi:methyl-accepting chemotaxis protein
MTSHSGGRFDRSFAIRMIRDFMIALLAIVVLELGARYALARYEFATEDREATELAAERLAGDVKDIMLNSGGPVAARTVYPIIRRHSEQAALEIAIVPSALTVEAIQQRFGFTPHGIAPDWSDGPHHESTVELHAETFCIQCHVTARPGDVLGQVTVRSYRSHRLAEWWREARVISVVGMGNVLLHTIVLFLLLRVRMEPLLRLRAAVASLARGRMDLGLRAEVRSDDEFGELAADFNHFLDRIVLLVEDLDDVLGKVAAVNQRLLQVGTEMDARIDTVQELNRDAMRRAYEIGQKIAGPWSEAVGALDLVIADRAGSPCTDGSDESSGSDESDGRGDFDPRMQDVLRSLRAAAAVQLEAAEQLSELTELLSRLSQEVAGDSHYRGEIRLLEERMQSVAESGQTLLARLRGPESDAGDARDSGG